ncbi:MAG: hypothetical protein KatS3mg096_108 [Candidatus Parcubacteria bacterium]|nr:MAG: hypothetical protein KatS3mg096_108 [Candidatus Parcubacteria bacterium]
MTQNQVLSKILNLIPRQKIFLLSGPLGAGKTTLTKLIAKKLKIKETLTSPTFVLWQKYQFQLKKKKYFLNHIDLYRIRSQDILKIGLKNELKKKNNIFFIEWGEKLRSYLKRKKIKFREIKIKIVKNKRIYLIK